MDPAPYGDVSKPTPSAFYGALSGSVCFPMPLMYNPMNSYPFMSTPFLPVHHPMLSQHGLPDSNHILNNDIVGNGTDALSAKSEDFGSRALAFLQSRYQNIGKCYLSPGSTRRQGLPKYCMSSTGLLDVSSNPTPTSMYGKDKPNSLYGQDSDRSGSVGLATLSEKESYLSSPTTEVEEPDSSGKCTADVEEQKVIPRWNCDPNQPPVCPICGRTINLSDLPDHYRSELDRLNDLVRWPMKPMYLKEVVSDGVWKSKYIRAIGVFGFPHTTRNHLFELHGPSDEEKKEWLNPDVLQSEQMARMDQFRLNPYHNVGKRCPEFRKETYLRVRANRMSRLGVCNARLKKQNFEDAERSWKMHRMRQLCSPKRENTSEEPSQNAESNSNQQSMLMLELTVQQLARSEEPRADTSPESCVRTATNLSVFQGPVLPRSENYQDEIPKTGDCPPLVDSSSSTFNATDFNAYQSSKCGTDLSRREETNTDGETCSTTDIKCFVCTEQYRKPVVSVCCWHVHCETCWLKALGNKRLCPQCETITSPADLRRIHL